MKLKPGDWVEVRSKEEILATLDKEGRLDGLPFMPEMLAFAGKRLRVYKMAHKTCDTIWQTGGRRMADAVHLEDSRCDGGGHGGCDAACLLFWKTAWLKPADGPAPAATAQPGGGCTEQDLVAATRTPSEGEPVYSCQATRLLEATTPLPWWDFRQYAQDFRCGNATAGQIFRGAVYAGVAASIRMLRGLGRKLGRDPRRLLVAAYDIGSRLVGGVPYPRKIGTIPAGQKTPAEVSNLQPGELVRIKSHKEILATLDTDAKNRGLFFDAEHVPFCGSTHRVRSRVNRIIDERTGKMLNFKTGSVILENVWCQARFSDRRMFCPRAIYPYWREIWLERAEKAAADDKARPQSAGGEPTAAPPG